MPEGTMHVPAEIRPTAIEALARGEIDIQIATAHRYPRTPKECLDRALSLATLTPEVAEQMGYALPREGKVIRGPSIRLAEIIGSTWGNVRYGARVIEIGDRYVTAQGVCHDLESNVAIQQEVRRRITGKSGQRYSDDMIVVTSNAACAIALREAIFKVIPRVLANQVYEAALKVAAGDMKSLVERRTRALEWFARTAGVQADRVLKALNRRSIDEVTVEDLATLNGLRQAIIDGETSVEEAFPIAAFTQPETARAQPAPAAPVTPQAHEAAPESKSTPAPTSSPIPERRRRTMGVTFADGSAMGTAGITADTFSLVQAAAKSHFLGTEILGDFLKATVAPTQQDLSFLREEEGRRLLAMFPPPAATPPAAAAPPAEPRPEPTAEQPEPEAQPEAPKPNGESSNAIECRGPNLGDRMTPAYCEAQCREVGDCAEYKAHVAKKRLERAQELI